MKFSLKNKINQTDCILFSWNERIHSINVFIFNIVTVLDFCNSCGDWLLFNYPRHHMRHEIHFRFVFCRWFFLLFTSSLDAKAPLFDVFFSGANRKAMRNDIPNKLFSHNSIDIDIRIIFTQRIQMSKELNRQTHFSSTFVILFNFLLPIRTIAVFEFYI